MTTKNKVAVKIKLHKLCKCLTQYLGHNKHSTNVSIGFFLHDFTLLNSYLIDRNNVFDVVVEAKINHVENPVTSQSCCKSFVEALESQAFLLNDVSCITHSGWLLQEREAKPGRLSLGMWNRINSERSLLQAIIIRDSFSLKHEQSCLNPCF